MKIVLTQIFFFVLFFAPVELNAQCNGCNVMVCDGIECDDGSPADGVQTSRNCGCGQEIGGACAIVEIDLNLNPYFDPDDPNCSLILTTQESGNFSIYFTDENCGVIDCNSPDFVVSNGETINNLPSTSNFSMMVCKNGGNAGRRDFNFSISCMTIENCMNGVDDDLDSFTDCDDTSCNSDTICVYTSTSTGADGGLESNGRLSEKISFRNYNRALIPDEDVPIPSYRISNDDQSGRGGQLNMRSDEELLSFMPIDFIENTETYNSSPLDLLQITNATEVLSIDIVQKMQSIATVFATKSADGVYEHTKSICDRLNGAEILNIWSHLIDGVHPFIVTKFQRSTGVVEYACNFSFFKKEDHMIHLESHWNLSDYTPHPEYYNFQIWANQMLHLERLVLEVIRLIESQGVIQEVNFSPAPELFVRKLSYSNTDLNIYVTNRNHAERLIMKGGMSNTEQTGSLPLVIEVPLSGDLHESISIPTNGIFDLGAAIYSNNSLISDAIYLSDGAWGLDLGASETMINNYEIRQSEKVSTPALQIERDVLLVGKTKGSVSLYRSLLPSFKGLNISGYNTLSFYARGEGDVEITIVQEGIEDWVDQMSTSVRLTNELEEYNIPLDRFYSAIPLKDWTEVIMIVFTLRSHGGHEQEFSLDLSGLALKNTEPKKRVLSQLNGAHVVYPNPIVDHATIEFSTTIPGKYYFQILSPSGAVIREENGFTSAGILTIPIQFFEDQTGLYMYVLYLPNGERCSGKLVVVK